MTEDQKIAELHLNFIHFSFRIDQSLDIALSNGNYLNSVNWLNEEFIDFAETINAFRLRLKEISWPNSDEIEILTSVTEKIERLRLEVFAYSRRIMRARGDYGHFLIFNRQVSDMGKQVLN